MKRKSNSESVKKSQRRKKLQAIEAFGGKCQVCNYDKCINALEFHHINENDKLYSPSYVIMRWSWEKAKKELDKCILLCCRCHRELHYKVLDIEYNKYLLPWINKECLFCQKIFDTKNEVQKYCCAICYSNSQRKVERPTKEELEKMLWELPSTHIAKKYGVSNKAIEKWTKSYGLQKPPRGYW